MKMVLLILAFLGATLVTGCSRDDDSKPDPGQSLIHLGTPACNGSDVCNGH